MKLSLLRRVGVVPLLAIPFVMAFLSTTAFATPPELSAPVGFQYPSEVLTGSAQTFEVCYDQASGDKPRSLLLVMQTPSGGITKIPAPNMPTADPDNPAAPLVATWYYTPQDAGDYKFHFETTSATGETARYPATDAEDPQFTAENLVTKYIILIVGLGVALIGLPYAMYVGTRSVNKSGDPAVTARVALLVGVLASYALYIYLFHAVYGVLLNIIVAIAAAAMLIVLFTRRK